MASIATFPSYPILQKLNNLDKSSSEFHVRLNDVLYAEEYIQCVTDIQGDNSAWLIDFLDNVGCVVCLGHHPNSRERRLLMVSHLLAPLPRNVCANLKTYVNPGRLSLHLARLRLA